MSGRVKASIGSLHRFWFSGWGFDTLYNIVFVRPFVFLAVVNKQDVIDKFYALMVSTSEAFTRHFCKDTGRYSSMVCYEHRYWCNTNFNPGAIVMILSAFIIILMAGGVVAWIAERWNPILSPVDFAAGAAFQFRHRVAPFWTEQSYLIESSHSSWLAKYEVPWIPISVSALIWHLMD